MTETVFCVPQVIASLSKHGADINELNLFRTALSETKGGKLALAAYPTKVLYFLCVKRAFWT